MTIKQIAQKYTHMPVRGEEENPYPAQEYIDAINALFDEMDIAKRWKSNELKKRARIIDQRDKRIAELEAIIDNKDVCIQVVTKNYHEIRAERDKLREWIIDAKKITAAILPEHLGEKIFKEMICDGIAPPEGEKT